MMMYWIRINTIFFIGIFMQTSIMGQTDSVPRASEVSSIPVSVFVENSVFTQPVAGATVTLTLRENYGGGNIGEELIGEFQTDEGGGCTVSLLPNQNYMIAIRRVGFFSQLSMLHTADFSRLNNNRAKISLRPRNLLTIRGKIIAEQTTPIEGTVALIDQQTGAKRTNAIASNGDYKIQGIKGEHYQLHVFVEGLIDTLVNVAELREEVFMGELSFLFDIPLEDALPPQPDYVTGDSLILTEVQFKGKTAQLSADRWLNVLTEKLLEDTSLKVAIHIHTDNRKSHRFNMLLAKKRMSFLEKEMLGRKVPATQFELIPRGEEEPLINCKRNCSEIEHLKNNRTVLIVKEGELYLD